MEPCLAETEISGLEVLKDTTVPVDLDWNGETGADIIFVSDTPIDSMDWLISPEKVGANSILLTKEDLEQANNFLPLPENPNKVVQNLNEELFVTDIPLIDQKKNEEYEIRVTTKQIFQTLGDSINTVYKTIYQKLKIDDPLEAYAIIQEILEDTNVRNRLTQLNASQLTEAINLHLSNHLKMSQENEEAKQTLINQELKTTNLDGHATHPDRLNIGAYPETCRLIRDDLIAKIGEKNIPWRTIEYIVNRLISNVDFMKKLGEQDKNGVLDLILQDLAEA